MNPKLQCARSSIADNLTRGDSVERVSCLFTDVSPVHDPHDVENKNSFCSVFIVTNRYLSGTQYTLQSNA